MFAHLISFSTQKLEEATMKAFSLLPLPAGFAVDGLGCSRGRSPSLAPSPASQDISRNISNAYRRYWCWWEKGWKRASAAVVFPQGECPCRSCWAAQQLSGRQWIPGEVFPRWNIVEGAVVLGSQLHVYTEERQEWWNRRREALLCLTFPGQTVQLTQTGLDCSGMAGGSWAAGDLLNLFLSLVPKGYNIAILKTTKCI